MPEVRIDTARPHRLWPIVLEKARLLLNQHADVLLLVPEQFSVSAEAEILKGLQINGSLRLEVSTPSRLYQRYVRLGDVTAAPLEETGFHMAVAQALESVREQLEYYRYSSYDPGFLLQMCTLLTELRHSSIGPEILLKYADASEDKTTQSKFRDIAFIYQQYLLVMNGRFSDGEDRLVFLGNLLLKNEALTNMHIIVFGFDTLTRQMMYLLTAMAKLSLSLDIVLCSDYQGSNDGQLFGPVRNSISRFLSMLQQEGIYAVSEHHRCELSESHEVFQFLDHTLFNSKNRYDSYASNQTVPILTKQAATPIEEAKWVAHHVRALIDAGSSPSDICIMYPNSSLYDALIPLTLAEYGVPCFSNPKLHLRNHRLPQFLVSALRCMADGWSQDDVLDVLHSGYTSLSTEESAVLERYIITANINHERFLKPFTRGKDADLTAKAEEIRVKWLTPMLTCREAIVHATTGTESVRAVYQLMLDMHVRETYQETLAKMCQYGLVERYRQEMPIWECVIHVLEQMALVAADRRIPLKHIAFRLQSGLDVVSMAILPYGSSHVQAGYIGHMIQLKADYVFLCGLNDDALSSETLSLIQREKYDLENWSDCQLGQTDRSVLTGNLLALKAAMLLPKKRLCLSYCTSNEKGEPQSPLRCLEEALNALIPEEKRLKSAPEPMPLSLPDLAGRIRSGEKLPSIAELNLNSKEKEYLRYALNLPHRENDPSLPAEVAAALYQSEGMSVSQLEKYQSCPYQYFLHYGLRPVQPNDWCISNAETGTFYHDAIHEFSEALKKEPHPDQLSEEQVKAMAQSALQPFAEELLKGPYGDGAFSKVKWQEAQQSVCDTAQMIWKQLQAGHFRIWKTETGFGYPGGLPPIVLVLDDQRQILLRGRIDRIDRLQLQDETLLSVIDYKSSSNKLEPGKAWVGLQLQLMLYLLACVQAQPNAKPAGAFYFWVHPFLEKCDSDMREVAEKAIQKAFRVKGFALTDIVTEEIHDAQKLTAEEMDYMLKHVYHRASEICQNILNGQISPTPIQSGENLPCRNCNYIRDCRFSAKAEARKIRTLPALSFDDLLNHLKTSYSPAETSAGGDK